MTEKIAIGLFSPSASIPTSSAETVETLKKVSPADNHFMSLGPGLWRFRRRRLAGKIRNAPREDFFENFGAQVKLGRVLVGTNRQRLREVSALELRLDFIDFVLLHDEEIAIDLRRHVVVFVVADLREIAEHPREGIGAGANEMADQLIVSRVGLGQAEQRLGQLPDVVVSLNVDIRLRV